MNILLLSQFFSTTRGGGEYVFSLITKKLTENNHRIWVITNKIIGEKYNEDKNCNFVFVPPALEHEGGLPPGFIDNIRYSFNAIKSGRDIIKNEKIDLIHSNNFAPALAGSILSSFTSKPHITTVHDVFSLCGEDYWQKWGKQANVSKINVLLAPFFEKLMIRLRYSCIHSVSEATKEDLIQFGAKKPIHVIPNSVLENNIEQSVENNPYLFVYVGRLVFYKNLELILKSIKIAKETEPKIKLVIVGVGPYHKKLKELTEKMDLNSNVEFRGYVNEYEKSKLIASSNALMFPSLCEGFGLVILEAFAKKRPVLVSNLRPMSDIVTHEKNGFVLDPNDE